MFRLDHEWVAGSDCFPVRYIDGRAYVEDVSVDAISAAYGTPTYVYSAGHVRRQYRALAEALSCQSPFESSPPLICYAVKANGVLAMLSLLAGLGAGADIVSVGELERALAAGVEPTKVVFSGVGKTADEIDRALSVGVKSLNVESHDELKLIGDRAKALGIVATVAIRVNPEVDPKTHPFLATGLRESKFGVSSSQAEELIGYVAGDPGLRLGGLACHIGSQIVDAQPFVDSIATLRELALRSQAKTGQTMQYFDIGGGLGIPYQPGDQALSVADWGAAIRGATRDLGMELVLEPGRFLVGNAGVLVTQVVRRKINTTRRFVVVDAAMNDLLRPALYGAYHAIIAANWPAPNVPAEVVDVVGPVCESGDFLGQARTLSGVVAGDLLLVLSAGAYAAAMSNNYNTRPRPAEVLVDGDTHRLIKPRQRVAELFADELI